MQELTFLDRYPPGIFANGWLEATLRAEEAKIQAEFDCTGSSGSVSCPGGGSALSESRNKGISGDEEVEILTNLLNASRLTTDAKRIGRDRYFHSSAMPSQTRDGTVSLLTCNRSMTAEDLVVRVNATKQTISLLHYPDFLTLAHPGLCCSLHADLDSGRISRRTYKHSQNCPILHRKELLVAPDHPSYNVFAALTREEVSLGLLDKPRRIGWSQFWDSMLAERGIEIVGHEIRNRPTDNR